MRITLVRLMFLAVLLNAVTVCAQNPNYNVGPVWRIVQMHIHPGQADAFWTDIRQHLKPIYDEQKKQGLITDYKVFVNPTANGPNDWSVTVGLLYANWAALDQVAAKAETITAQHYGSRQAMMQAAKARADLADVVANHLVREVTLK